MSEVLTASAGAGLSDAEKIASEFGEQELSTQWNAYALAPDMLSAAMISKTNKRLILMSHLFLVFICSCTTQSAGHITPQGVESFKIAYGLSYKINACGDPLTAQLFRKALVDKFVHCHPSSSTWADFRKWMKVTDKKATLQIQSLAESGPSKRLTGMTTACSEALSDSKYQSLKERLSRYSAQKAMLDNVIPGTCNEAPSFP